MAVLSLPLTFSNSFWTQDYRKGLEVLYGQLEQSIAENSEIASFIRVSDSPLIACRVVNACSCTLLSIV